MSNSEFQLVSWIFVLAVCGLAVSWLVLVMQAFFHDRRIGFACVFGGAAAALAMALSETLSHTLLWVLLVVNLLLIGGFAIRQFAKPFVYIPLIMLLISGSGALWVWRRLVVEGLI